ncbi:17852_t:CDS:2 [Funneliformis geosporum]|uniref:5417_t:CDS:1 n=1 Tax=Funneliformis geosporum TaxID=1117311 RepID=A0A9W4WM10_9GLOM|nr:17852_t:CDS:2 [Funneliformis geosporum]CAI2171485.1 5417_t:CDS:2 [Funneliformis geosporum]
MSFSKKHTPKSSQGSISSEGDIFFEAITEVINEVEELTFNNDNNDGGDSTFSTAQKTSSVYMTPQSSTSNLLINAMKQTVIYQNTDIEKVGSSSSQKKYNHTVEPSSGSNTYVADSYDHIELESNTNHSNHVKKDDDECRDEYENKFSRKDITQFKSSDSSNKKKFTNDESSVNIDLNTEKRAINNNVKNDFNKSYHNGDHSSKEIIIVEDDDNMIKNSKRNSKLSFIITRDDSDILTSKSESITEMDNVDSLISQKNISITKEIITEFSSIASFKEDFRESIKIERKSKIIQLKKKDKILWLIGSCLIFFIIILDINLVANQLPKIIQEFKAGENILWIITSYNLANVS